MVPDESQSAHGSIELESSLQRYQLRLPTLASDCGVEEGRIFYINLSKESRLAVNLAAKPGAEIEQVNNLADSHRRIAIATNRI